MKTVKALLFTVTFASFAVHTAFAQIGATWTSVAGLVGGITANYIAMTANGAEIAITSDSTNSLYTSTNSGATWTYRTNFYGDVVCSADGTMLAVAAANNQIFISTNWGVTWNPSGIYTPFGTTIACSLDGKTLVAPGNISTNSGVTWAPLSGITWSSLASPVFFGNLAACSGNGTKLAVAASDGTIDISTNSGTSWTPSGAPTTPYWQSIAMSADGNTLIACTIFDENDPLAQYMGGNGRGEIYFSTNAGTSWTEVGYGEYYQFYYWGYWQNVSISADGQTMAAASYDLSGGFNMPGLILTSTDSGVTWKPASVSGGCWRDVAVSADGTAMGAVGGAPETSSEAYINIGANAGAPALNISTAGGSAFLSWPFLTPGYVLQQNSNLATTNWVNVTNVPAVVNQVISAPTGPNNFYRLAKP